MKVISSHYNVWYAHVCGTWDTLQVFGTYPFKGG